MKSRATPGPAWQRGRGVHPARSHRQEMKGRGGVIIFGREATRGGVGPVQGSPSNYRLQATVGGLGDAGPARWAFAPRA